MQQMFSLFLITILLNGSFAGLWQQTTTLDSAAPAAETSAPAIVLKEGTEIKLKFAQSLSTKSAVVGDRVEFVVADNVLVDNSIAIKAGTRALGKVTTGKESEKKRNDASALAVQLEYLKVGATRVKLRSAQTAAEKGKVDKAKVVAATALFGVSGLLIALSSKRLVIPEGTPVLGYVAEDVQIGSSDTI
jgi:hypothetical protein